jgi:hypothetical protein
MLTAIVMISLVLPLSFSESALERSQEIFVGLKSAVPLTNDVRSLVLLTESAEWTRLSLQEKLAVRVTLVLGARTQAQQANLLSKYVDSVTYLKRNERLETDLEIQARYWLLELGAKHSYARSIKAFFELPSDGAVAESRDGIIWDLMIGPRKAEFAKQARQMSSIAFKEFRDHAVRNVRKQISYGANRGELLKAIRWAKQHHHVRLLDVLLRSNE